MPKPLQERIVNAKLTKTEQVLADYILSNFKACTFFTSTELASNSKVSHTTVLRFIKNLGFTGYSSFQKSIRVEFHSHLEVQNAFNTPSEKLATNMTDLEQGSIIESVFKTVNANIESAIERNTHHSFDAATNAIINANTKYVIGSRGSMSITSFLALMLRDSLPNVHTESLASGNTFDLLSDINENDCLIISSFSRYSKLSLLAAQMAKEVNATIIVITDTPTAPIAKYATHLFTTKTDTLTFFNSYIAPMFIAEILVTYICKKIGMQNRKKLELINRYISEMELY